MKSSHIFDILELDPEHLEQELIRRARSAILQIIRQIIDHIVLNNEQIDLTSFVYDDRRKQLLIRWRSNLFKPTRLVIRLLSKHQTSMSHKQLATKLRFIGELSKAANYIPKLQYTEDLQQIDKAYSSTLSCMSYSTSFRTILSSFVDAIPAGVTISLDRLRGRMLLARQNDHISVLSDAYGDEFARWMLKTVIFEIARAPKQTIPIELLPRFITLRDLCSVHLDFVQFGYVFDRKLLFAYPTDENSDYSDIQRVIESWFTLRSYQLVGIERDQLLGVNVLLLADVKNDDTNMYSASDIGKFDYYELYPDLPVTRIICKSHLSKLPLRLVSYNEISSMLSSLA